MGEKEIFVKSKELSKNVREGTSYLRLLLMHHWVKSLTCRGQILGTLVHLRHFRHLNTGG